LERKDGKINLKIDVAMVTELTSDTRSVV